MRGNSNLGLFNIGGLTALLGHITDLARPSVRLSACPGQAANSKTRRRRKTELGVNVARDGSNRCAAHVLAGRGQRSGWVDWCAVGTRRAAVYVAWRRISYVTVVLMTITISVLIR